MARASALGLSTAMMLALLGVTGSALTLASKPVRSATSGDNQVVVASWGGGFGDAQRAAQFAPFAEETGIEVELPDLPYSALWPILDVEPRPHSRDLTLSGRDDLLVRQDDFALPNFWRTARFYSAVDFVQAQRLRRKAMEAMEGVFTGIDAMIGSSVRGSMLEITNFTGHPSLTLRVGFVEQPGRGIEPPIDDPDLHPDRGGPSRTVPHGVTLWGRLFDEGTLCTIGMALEAEFGVADRRPPVD